MALPDFFVIGAPKAGSTAVHAALSRHPELFLPSPKEPKYFMLDGTLAKTFNIKEKFKTELKMAAYNAINRLNLGNPNMSVTSSQFGQALYQGTPAATFGPQTMELGNVSGRQVELGLKITF